MKEFLHPRFEGARFEEHTLPLEVIRDLAAYETLIIELARHLYLKDHSGRKRVPKGFEGGFHLHLERVDEGSTCPVLSVFAADGLALQGLATDYFERARDMITDCIASAEDSLPANFPKSLLTWFNQVGRSLRSGEAMEISRPGQPGARLTPEKRQRLVLAAQSYYEETIELAGHIEVTNWKQETFRLRLGDGRVIDVPMPASFHRLAGEHGGRERVQILVRGVGAFDHHKVLQKVLKVTALEVQPDYQIAARLDAVGALAEGWYEGRGHALDAHALALVYESVVGQYPDELPLPVIAPTPEGNLLLEWPLPGDPSLDLMLPILTGELHAFREGEEDLEQTFPLRTPDDWKNLWKMLDALQGERRA